MKESLPIGAFPEYISQSDIEVDFEKLLPKKMNSNLPVIQESKYLYI